VFLEYLLSWYPSLSSLAMNTICARNIDELSDLYCHQKATMDARMLLRNVQQFRGGLVFKAHRLCVSLNSRLESNKEEKHARSSAFAALAFAASNGQ